MTDQVIDGEDQEVSASRDHDPSTGAATPKSAAPARIDLQALIADEAKIPAAPWELWTSCSFRRITGPDGKEGGVLHAYNQRSDGHPDLSMPEDQLFALVRLRNALPRLLSHLRELQEENARLREAIDAHIEAERLDAEYQELVSRADAEGWDEQTGGSYLASTWAPVALAYGRARDLRQALTTPRTGEDQ